MQSKEQAQEHFLINCINCLNFFFLNLWKEHRIDFILLGIFFKKEIKKLSLNNLLLIIFVHPKSSNFSSYYWPRFCLSINGLHYEFYSIDDGLLDLSPFLIPLHVCCKIHSNVFIRINLKKKVKLIIRRDDFLEINRPFNSILNLWTLNYLFFSFKCLHFWKYICCTLIST